MMAHCVTARLWADKLCLRRYASHRRPILYNIDMNDVHVIDMIIIIYYELNSKFMLHNYRNVHQSLLWY